MTAIIYFLAKLACCTVIYFITRASGEEKGWSKRRIVAVYVVGAFSFLIACDLLS